MRSLHYYYCKLKLQPAPLTLTHASHGSLMQYASFMMLDPCCHEAAKFPPTIRFASHMIHGYVCNLRGQ